MKIKKPIRSIVVASIAILAILFGYTQYSTTTTTIKSGTSQAEWSAKKKRVKGGQEAFSKPDGFIEYFNSTSKKIGEETSSYKKGYRAKELNKVKIKQASSRSSVKPLDVEFISRGPGNVGGRTRAIAIDPDDASHCTWIAGAASGGLWKTIDCGLTWTNISPDLPNLSTNSIAQAASNPDVIYVGTGEVFAGNSSFVRGDGIFKSTDRGVTWNLLPSTVDNNDYLSVNRIAVDPTNEDIVVIGTNTGVFKSLDGGVSWLQVYNAAVGANVQDLQVDPTDFNIQYAGVNGLGIIKSTDGGDTWVNSSAGIPGGSRFELAVAPSDPNVLYTSTWISIEGANNDITNVYASLDKGASWTLIDDPTYNTNFLNEQGWYDNTIEVNPYDPYEVFVGGVNVGKYQVDPASTSQTEAQFLGIDLENTNFLSFIAYGAGFYNGSLEIANGNLSPSQNPVNVEIRWGGDNTQKAHRFTVPVTGGTDGNGGAGIPTTNYTYQDYIDVPFEVWDIDNDRQLMVSFRDQEDNGVYNLNPRDDVNDPALLKAREYFYIHDLDYNATTPNTDVTTTVGGVEFANMYYFWPVLTVGANWAPENFNNAVMRIKYGSQTLMDATAVAVYDAYGSYEGQNQSTLHPDHHNLTFVKTNEANEEFMVINGNDGAFGFSTDNGITFEERESGYVTSQFYGADKKPGEDKYIGGMQDNGTYVSSGSTVDATNEYNFVIGGDGFEVIWHATNTNLVIGGSQNNGLSRSTNGGASFTSARAGITDGPFITRLAGSNTSPDVIYAIGAAGVYKSTNFGANWSMKAIDAPTWNGSSSSCDVEVSLANDQIVWAGAGMAEGVVDMFVSTDAGETYTAVNKPTVDPGAFTTGIYTHPSEENTAYVLFSVANEAKIYKTEDLGQTWTEFSGYGNGTESTTGLPDVYTHSLLVMPFDEDIIWVGTEIGLFESLDGGASWNFRDDYPAASIWSMKIVDDQVVIGTHGRGIWTATISELASAALNLSDFTYSGYGKASITASLPVEYERIQIIVDGETVVDDLSPAVGESTFDLPNFFAFDGTQIQLIGTDNGVDYTRVLNTDPIDVTPEILSASSPTDVTTATYPVTLTVENNEPFEKVEVYIDGSLVYTDEQSLVESDPERVIEFDFDQAIITNNLEITAFINGIQFTSKYNQQLVTSNRNELTEMLKVYPNPVVDVLNIDNAESLRNIKIYTSAGKLVYKKQLGSASQRLSVNFATFKEGLYLVQVEDKQGVIATKRIIKN